WAILPFNWREPDFVTGLGRQIKSTVAERIGPSITVSVGAGPNRYLAKIASKMEKPDGLHIIEHRDLPTALHGLQLRDLTGIGRSMEDRLHTAGIRTVKDLCAAPKAVLRGVWGGVQGERMWHLLRGDDLPEAETVRRSLGHSHVLPPEERTPSRAWPVLCKLLHKACERLRSHGMLAGSLSVQLVRLGGPDWSQELRFGSTDSTLHLVSRMRELWKSRPEPEAKLLQVGVVLGRLAERTNHTPDLFEETDNGAGAGGEEGKPGRHSRLDAAIDQLRARYGRGCVHYASAHEARGSAPMRIAFSHVPDTEVEGD
ncbi:MAG TPA: DNA polymerase, partial [Bacteroidia bacterium]|nr:DNA polymerase [Bacteroidia bacterium]